MPVTGRSPAPAQPWQTSHVCGPLSEALNTRLRECSCRKLLFAAKLPLTCICVCVSRGINKVPLFLSNKLSALSSAWRWSSSAGPEGVSGGECQLHCSSGVGRSSSQLGEPSALFLMTLYYPLKLLSAHFVIPSLLSPTPAGFSSREPLP